MYVRQLWLIASFSAVLVSALYEPPVGDADIAEIANRTYWEESVEMQRCLLRDYDRTQIPQPNPFAAASVKINARFHHITVDEHQQTMTAHGHLEMEWWDYNLVCSDRRLATNDVVHFHQWLVWYPQLYLWNSAMGAGVSEAIDRYTRITVEPMEGRSKVTTRPPATFAFTCRFDYADYPEDEHSCPLVLYGPASMRRFKLDTDAWSAGYKKPMDVLGNWYVTESKQNISYWSFYGNKISEERPDAANHTMYRSVYNVWFGLKRRAPYHNTVTVLPAVMTSALTLTTYSLHDFAAVLLLLCNILMQCLSSMGYMIETPPGNGIVPKHLTFYVCNLGITLSTLLVRIAITKLANVTRPASPWLQAVVAKASHMPLVGAVIVNAKAQLVASAASDSSSTAARAEDNDKENDEMIGADDDCKDGTSTSKPYTHYAWQMFGKLVLVASFAATALAYAVSSVLWLK